MRDDPFARAAGKARPLGVCPVNMLDEPYANRRDHDSLCSGFACKKCVATPEDFGNEHWWRPGEEDEGTGSAVPDGTIEECEIDF